MSNIDFPRSAFSIEQVRERTGFCRDALYKLIKDGKLVARKCGKRTVVLADDLDSFNRCRSSAARREPAPSHPSNRVGGRQKLSAASVTSCRQTRKLPWTRYLNTT